MISYSYSTSPSCPPHPPPSCLSPPLSSPAAVPRPFSRGSSALSSSSLAVPGVKYEAKFEAKDDDRGSRSSAFTIDSSSSSVGAYPAQVDLKPAPVDPAAEVLEIGTAEDVGGETAAAVASTVDAVSW